MDVKYFQINKQYSVRCPIETDAAHARITAETCISSPAHTMRFLSFVGRRDNERRTLAQCERADDNRLSLSLPTRQLLDRFENRIGPTSVEPV